MGKFTERIIKNQIGEEVHIFDDEDTGQQVRIKKLKPMIFNTGKQYCPECHRLANHFENGRYWECDICKWSITDEEASDGEGYPTYESTFRDDYGEWEVDDYENDIPEGCEACGGPYPDCIASCNLFDE